MSTKNSAVAQSGDCRDCELPKKELSVEELALTFGRNGPENVKTEDRLAEGAVISELFSRC
jgi:hypothetical protein